MIALIKASQFLLGISILVLIHELGHFLAARMFGIKVEKFFLFFDVGGTKLFSIKRGETEYGIGWLPLGGYVKITGMIDESLDKSVKETPPQPYEFRSKPAWQRLIVMLAGIIMNVILGIIIFTFHTWHFGEEYVPASELQNGIVAHSLAKEVGFRTGDKIVAMNHVPLKNAMDIERTNLLLDKNLTYQVIRDGKEVDITIPDNFGKRALQEGLDSFIEIRQTFSVEELMPGKGAEKAGLQPGDHIISVNDTATPYFADLSRILSHNKDKNIRFVVQRPGMAVPVTLTAHIDKSGLLGFKPKLAISIQHYDFAESVAHGTNRAWHAISDNVKGLWRLVTGDLPANSVHSLIGIANAYSAQWDWNSFWALTGTLSMVLAFMNLLPIPALDGGHVIFLLVEMVRRRPLSYKFLEVAQMVGMVLLFLLMGFALYNDFAQYVFKH
jgi:regulator of sigma E protease